VIVEKSATTQMLLPQSKQSNRQALFPIQRFASYSALMPSSFPWASLKINFIQLLQ
jgi:hypothetical protein